LFYAVAHIGAAGGGEALGRNDVDRAEINQRQERGGERKKNLEKGGGIDDG